MTKYHSEYNKSKIILSSFDIEFVNHICQVTQFLTDIKNYQPLTNWILWSLMIYMTQFHYYKSFKDKLRQHSF